MHFDTRQIYATPTLNSLQPYTARAQGQLAWSLEYNSSRTPGHARSLLVQGDRRLLIDFGSVFFVLNLERKIVVGSQWKDDNSYLLLRPGGDLYYCESNLLFHQTVDSVGVRPEESCFLPGLAPGSEVMLLLPGDETLLFGIQSYGNPNDDRPVFGMLEKLYSSLADKWMVQFAGVVVRPAVSSKGTVAVASGNRLSLILQGGAKGREIRLPMSATHCSIGPDDRIYIAGATKSGCVLLAFEPDGTGLWQCPVSMPAIIQPPLVDEASTVTLVGPAQIMNVANGEERWRFPLSAREGIFPAASLSNDGSILMAVGHKVVSFDRAGKVAWIYEHGRDEVFRAPPVIDARGIVYVASDSSIIALK